MARNVDCWKTLANTDGPKTSHRPKISEGDREEDQSDLFFQEKEKRKETKKKPEVTGCLSVINPGGH